MAISSKSARIFIGAVVAGGLLAHSAISASAPFGEIAVGQPITDGITYGQMTVKLPPGNWSMAWNGKDTFNQQTGTGAAQFQYLGSFVVKIEDNRLVALLWTGSLAQPMRVSEWRDDPCDAYSKDKRLGLFTALDGRIFMPACLAVTNIYRSDQAGGNYRAVMTSLRDKGVEVPEWVYRTYFAKYVVGNYLQANLIVPATVSQQEFQAWAKRFGEAGAQSVARDGVLEIPELPKKQ